MRIKVCGAKNTPPVPVMHFSFQTQKFILTKIEYDLVHLQISITGLKDITCIKQKTRCGSSHIAFFYHSANRLPGNSKLRNFFTSASLYS